jgi:DNA-binding MarR family transcriptional regulator
MALDPESLHGLAEFRFALRRFLAASETISRLGGVTPQQYQAMLAIKTSPTRDMSMKDLAEQLLFTRHAAVQLVNRLASAGLARRTPSRDDRRSVILTLTAEGEALVERLASEHLSAMLRQEPSLTRSLRRLRRMSREHV